MNVINNGAIKVAEVSNPTKAETEATITKTTARTRNVYSIVRTAASLIEELVDMVSILSA
jgi:hypothetical protein